MRIILTLVSAFIFSLTLNAQIQFAPLEGNAVLRQQHALQQKARIDKYGDYTAVAKTDCPPAIPFVYVATAGQGSVSITIDTTTANFFGDSIQTLSLLEDCSTLNGGTVTTGQTNNAGQATNLVLYEANDNVTVAFDTICVEICTFNNDCATFSTPVLARRAGTSYSVTGPTVAPYSIEDSFCVDASLLEGEPACSEVLECADSYDGEGQQFVRPSLFNQASDCIFYESSGFPGEDLVCYQICDEYGICDTFNVVYTITGETIDLPFFDDFSDNAGVYPNFSHWLDRDVYINNTYAPNPPSVGMASFDGITPSGSPYPFFGIGDRLTSKQIDMSGLNAADEVYFKCYIANEGYGLSPEQSDFLRLEFRDENRDWVEIKLWNGPELPPTTLNPFPFEFFEIKIEDAEFFHDAFQFRFTSSHSPGGNSDIWSVDYVKIETNDEAGQNYNDVCFTNTPRSLLRRYTSMPWPQFKANIANELRNDSLLSNYFNHRDQTASVATDSEARVTDLISNQQIGNTVTVTNAADGNIPSLEYKFITNNNTGDFWPSIASDLSNLPASTEKAALALNYSYVFNNQTVDAFSNDAVNFVTPLDDYYAYDDGTAEKTVVLINEQNDQPQIAMRFRTNTEGTLRGLRLMFPHLTAEDQTNQFFNLKVWVDPSGSNNNEFLNENEPIYVREFVQPTYPDSFTDTLQALTTYSVEDENGEPTPITIPANADFYIGFQQVSTSAQGIPVGFDTQYDARPHTFVSLGGAFNPISEQFEGAIILRPIFGDVDPGNTAVDNISLASNTFVQVSPNPTSGELSFRYLQGNASDFTINVYNNVGQMVSSKKSVTNMDISKLPAGLYHLEFLQEKNGQRFFEKIILTK